jgi:hypothetical protein
MGWILFLLQQRGSSKKEARPRPMTDALMIDAEGELPFVETETVKLLACPLVRAKAVGLMEQTAPAGAPEHARVTVPLSPGVAFRDKLYIAV